MKITRRRFVVAGLTAVGAALSGYSVYRAGKHVQPMEPPRTSEVYLTEASDRTRAVKRLTRKFDSAGFKGTKVALKANYNSADPFPASTHIETLQAVVKSLQDAGAAEIVLAERSGMGNTRRVLEDRGVFKLASDIGFRTVVLDEVPAEGWTEIGSDGLHWLRGFKIAKIFRGPEGCPDMLP